MKTKELLKKDNASLMKDLTELRSKLAKVKIETQIKKEKNHQKAKFMKRDIARILTIIKEREFIAQGEVASAETKEEAAK